MGCLLVANIKTTATGSIVIQSNGILPRNFTLVDIQAPLGHVPHSSLRLFGAVGVEVVNVRRLVCDFKITNAAVALIQKENKANTN